MKNRCETCYYGVKDGTDNDESLGTDQLFCFLNPRHALVRNNVNVWGHPHVHKTDFCSHYLSQRRPESPTMERQDLPDDPPCEETGWVNPAPIPLFE